MTKRNNTKQPISSPGFKGNINLKSYEPREAGLAESMIPIWGDIQDINEIFKSVDKKDYTSAAVGAGLLFAPNWLEKPIKKAGKVVYNNLVKELTKLISIVGGAALFNNINKNEEE